MKILITGGAGYLGCVLVDYLLNQQKSEEFPYKIQEDVEIVVLDNLLYEQTSLIQFSHLPNFRFIYGDVRNYDLLHKWTLWADVIFPLACIVGWPACQKNGSDLEVWNINCTHVEEIANICGVFERETKIIFPNTNSGYGAGKHDEEKRICHCTEETPLNPISLYGETKKRAEEELWELYSHNSVVFRLATVFGVSSRMRLDLLVNDFVYRAVTDKNITLFEHDYMRNFIHIRDVARTFVYAINNFEQMRGNVFNVGLSNANLNKLQLCEKIREYVGFSITYNTEYTDPDKRNYMVSNEKLEKTGWKPKYSLEDGIEELIKGFQILKNVRNRWSNI